MKKTICLVVLAVLVVFISGCSKVQSPSSLPGPAAETPQAVSGVEDLMLSEQDLEQLGIAKDADEQRLEQLGITGTGTNCKTEEQTGFDMSRVDYGVCIYIIHILNDTNVIIEFKKFANMSELDNTYQYDSSHLYSVEGLISEDDFGDKSRFRVSNENDYGGQYNPLGVYFYHLWMCKDEYLIHITSSGTDQGAREYIASTGRLILSKFG